MSKIIIVAAVLTALSLVTGAIAAEGDVVPKRKPGAWEIITVAPVSGMTKATICVGEDDDTRRSRRIWIRRSAASRIWA